MGSYDNNGINTTSLAKNLSEINDLTDTNNQAITENTEITLPIVVILNNKNYKITTDGNITLPVYIVKNGTLINTNYIIPDADENSTLTQQDGYVEYYAYTPSQYKTGIGWKFEGEKEFEKLTMVWNAPERSDSAAWGAQLFIGKDQPIYELGREHYPNASYGAYELFKNGSNVINNVTTTSFNLRPQNNSEHWYIDLQTYFRAANGIHWRKFNIYDLYLEILLVKT